MFSHLWMGRLSHPAVGRVATKLRTEGAPRVAENQYTKAGTKEGV